jgi:ElaB/YqjD/DUF883 family membrane-anchored ribosome-binding protein
MGETTEELMRDIDDTRSSMSGTLEAIGDRVSPGRVLERRRNRVVNWYLRSKDRVMGTAENLTDRAGDTAHRVGDTAHRVSDAPGAAMDTVRSNTAGAPLVTGGIAFGIGLLVGSLIPPSRTERQLGQQAQHAVEPVKNELQEAGRDLVQNLREPVTEAVKDVKETARSGAEQVRQQTSESTDEIKQAPSR